MLLSGRCLYELRNVIASGTFAENSIEIASARLIEGEQRDYEPNKNFSWVVDAPTLKGHVQSVVLRDNAEPAVVKYDLGIAPAGYPSVSSGAVSQNEGANINGFFDFLSSRRAIVVITTDIPARQTVTVPLTNIERDDWSRPYCS